jgi:hypothetical protein
VFELVREEILAEHRMTLEKLTSAESSIQALSSDLAAEQMRRTEAADRLATAAMDLEKVQTAAGVIAHEKGQLAEQLGRTDEKRLHAEGRASILETETNQTRIALCKARFINWFVLLPALLSVVAWAIVFVFGVGRDLTPSQRFWVLCLAATLPVLVSCWTAKFYVKHNSDIESWWLPKAMQKLWWAIGVIVALAVEGVFQGHIYDLFKELRGP